MSTWSLTISLLVGGIGVLAFLKIVGNEVMFARRVAEIRQEARRDELKKARQSAQIETVDEARQEKMAPSAIETLNPAAGPGTSNGQGD